MSSYLYIKGTNELPSSPFTDPNLSSATGYEIFKGVRLAEYPAYENEAEISTNLDGSLPHRTSFRTVIDIVSDWEPYPTPANAVSIDNYIKDEFGVFLKDVLNKKYLFIKRETGTLYADTDTTINARVVLDGGITSEHESGFYRYSFKLKYRDK